MRKQYRSLILLAMVLLTISLAGCSLSANPAQQAGEPTEIAPVVASNQIVVDGRVVPAEDVELSFNSSGEVADVLVKEGDVVKTGDVIARIGDRAQLESTIAKSKLELLTAQQELLSAQQDRQVLFDDLPAARTAALDELTQALKTLDNATKKSYSVANPARQTDIDEAKAAVTLAKKALDDAMKEYKPYRNTRDTNLQKAYRLQQQAAAQRKYDDAVRRYNDLISGASDFYVSQAEAEYQIAQERVAQAQKDYDDLQAGPDPDELVMVESRINTANGRITAAEAAINAAEEELKNLDLVATINGTVVKLDLIPGQQVSPGTTVVQLADQAQWYVETDNLTEIEVVDITLDQSALITPDALLELNLTGVVESINNVYEEKRGDVTYTARIKLNETDPRLRWGMTTVVTFEK